MQASVSNSHPEPEWLRASEAAFDETFPFGRAPRAHLLNRCLCRALAPLLVRCPDDREIQRRPLTLPLHLPLPPAVRFYVFTATQNRAERQAGAFRVQLTDGEPAGDNRYRFRREEGIRPLLVGYVPQLKVFILWDANLHDARRGFAHSRGVQAPPQLVYGALGQGLQVAARAAGGPGSVEEIVAARPDRFADALRMRIDLSNAVLLGSR